MELAKNNTISLRIEGKKITSDKFSDGINNFYGFINEVAFKVFGERHPIKWIVTVGRGSFTLNNSPELVKDLDMKKQEEFFSEIQSGINILEKETTYPKSFNDSALVYLRHLASLPDKENGVTKVDIIIDNKKNTLNKHIITNVDTLINVYGKAMSSITGKLYTITETGGRHVVVYNDRTLKAVYCYFKSDELLQYALKAFGKRVYVYGTISYDSGGKPKSIQVKKIMKFKDESELPHIFKTSGIIKGV